MTSLAATRPGLVEVKTIQIPYPPILLELVDIVEGSLLIQDKNDSLIMLCCSTWDRDK